MRCAIWYYLCNLKNVKNNYGGVLLLHVCFSRFLNCTNGTKSRKISQIVLHKHFASGLHFINKETELDKLDLKQFSSFHV